MSISKNILHFMRHSDYSFLRQRYAKIKIRRWFSIYYWNWKEKFEKRRMHPNNPYLLNIVNNFD